MAVAGSTSPGLAANECGAEGVGADTIVCTGASYPAPDGISYSGTDGLTLTLNNPNLVAQRTSVAFGGVFVNGGASNVNDLVINAISFLSVDSNSNASTGIGVTNSGTAGNAIIRMDTGTVTSRSGSGALLSSIVGGAGNALVTLNNGQVTNTLTGIPSYGVSALNSGTGNATVVMNGGSIQTTTASTGTAVRASITNAASTATSSITINGGSITGGLGVQSLNSGRGLAELVFNAGTVNAGASGLLAQASNATTGLAQTTINGGTIIASTGYGARANNTGVGNAAIIMNDGSVTGGTNFAQHGLATSASNGSAQATFNGGQITARASSGNGVYASVAGGTALATMTGGTVLTSGIGGMGLGALSNITATAVMSGGAITTQGNTANGIWASGTGQAIVQMTGGTVTANGNSSDGIHAIAAGASGTYNVSITGGAATGGTGNGAGLHTVSATGGSIAIGANAILNGGASGVALRDGDANRDGVDENGGTATITTAGTLNGAVLLGNGNDTLTVTGGAINGNITGGGTASLTFNLGAGNSITYGAPYTISGMSGVTVNSGTVIVDGSLTGPVAIAGGTLQLGNGATSGAITSGIVNNATFAFNRSDALTFANVISGTGLVAQNGSGTTILTGANTYSGGTAINAGTLQVASDAVLGDAAGGLTFNGGTLQNTAAFTTARALALTGAGTVQTDADLTLSGVASGAGGLTKTGTGSLILTGANSYTGGTTISAGTLQIGNGGTTGSLAGNVTNNASLAFNRSDAIAFGGVISGTGSVRQLGGGTTSLSGSNTYGGGTTIGGGTLIGSASSFGSGAITNSAALIINQPADAGFANAINGTGSFTKQGAGRLNYTGTGSLSGATTVAAGLLSVNGSLANSAITVQSGASLGGSGTVGATAVQSGGTIAPGNSIGTLQVNGAYTQASGSTYQVEVDPNTNASDRIAVTGTATLQSGAGLNVTKSVAGDYRAGTIYTVLTTTGGRTGTYTLSGETTGVSAYLALLDSYDANNAYLTVVQTRDPADAAQTPNQQAVADNVPAGGVTTPILNLPSDDAARSAFDQLSAQALASAKGALVSNGLYVRDATLDRLRDVRCKTTDNQDARRAACESEQPSLWAQGFGGWGGVAGNANASGLNRSSAGMLAGFDLPILDWRAGLFAGFSNSDFHLTGGPAGGQSTDYHLGAYAGTNWDNINVSLGASYTWNTIRTDRSVAFGNFTDRLQATYNAGLTQVFAEAGYGMEMEGITLEPFANLAYLNLRTDGFTEVGGAAALTSQADTIENAITTFGVRPSMDVDLGSFPMTVRGMAGWRHTFGTITPTSTVAFAGGNNFTISGAPIARDAVVLEAGGVFALFDAVSAGLTYGSQLSSRTTDQTLRGTIRVAF